MSSWQELDPEKKEKLAKALQNVDFLAAFGSENINTLLDGAQMRDFEPGEVILLKGEISEALYVIGSGKAVVSLKKDPKILNRSDYFGEMSLFLKRAVSCTVKASEEGVHVLAVPGKLLNDLIQTNRKAKDLVQAKMRDRGIGTEEKKKK